MLESQRPPAVLAARLLDARRVGASFCDAWPVALASALAVTYTRAERLSWSAVLGGMVSTWRSAFEREPASEPEAAMALITYDDRVPIPEHPCSRCGEEIKPDRLRRHARFCSEPCRKAAGDEVVSERRASQREQVLV
jgi:hypothetical protein